MTRFKRLQLLFLISVLVIALCGFSNAFAKKSLDPHTVLYMSFDQEPDGDIYEDESGYENHGTIVGNGLKWINDGKFSGAVELDGTTKINVPHSDNLNLGKEITLEIWYRTDLPQKGRFFIYKIHTGGGRNYEWGIYLTSDSTAVSMYIVAPDDEVKTAGVPGDFKDDEWHFLAGTYDGAVIQCYSDGELASTAWATDIRTGEDMVVIGTWGNNFFSGAIDEVRISNEARSENQLKSDYEAGYNLFAVDSIGKLSTTWAQIKDE